MLIVSYSSALRIESALFNEFIMLNQGTNHFIPFTMRGLFPLHGQNRWTNANWKMWFISIARHAKIYFNFKSNYLPKKKKKKTLFLAYSPILNGWCLIYEKYVHWMYLYFKLYIYLYINDSIMHSKENQWAQHLYKPSVEGDLFYTDSCIRSFILQYVFCCSS